MQPGKRFLVWLAGLSVLGFLATDMYLPAFAAIQADLQTPASAVSASLSLFLAGFAAAQLLWGPLSDRYGRKPVLLIGLTIFALGSLGMLWVENAATPAGIAFCTGCGGLRRGGYLASVSDGLLSFTESQPYFCDHHAAGGSVSGTCSPVRKLAAGPFFLAGDFRHPVCHYRGADSAYFLAQTHDEGP